MVESRIPRTKPRIPRKELAEIIEKSGCTHIRNAWKSIGRNPNAITYDALLALALFVLNSPVETQAARLYKPGERAPRFKH